MNTPATTAQAILIACGDKAFAHSNGFKESRIRDLLHDHGYPVHDLDFYEIRVAGGAAAVRRSSIGHDFIVDEIATFVNGPIRDRAGDSKVDEVLVIATIHRSCGGCKAMIGQTFDTDAELAAIETILRGSVRSAVELANTYVAPTLRLVGVILEHNGAPTELVEFSAQPQPVA